MAQHFSVTDGRLERERERFSVEQDLNPVFQTAEESAATTFNAHAVPLLQSWNNPDPEKIKAAKPAFESAQRQLDAALQVFDKAGPYQDKGIAAVVRQGRAYLEEWSKFFALFEKTVAQPPPWPAEEEQALLQATANVGRAQAPLANSSLLQSNYKRIQIDK